MINSKNLTKIDKIDAKIGDYVLINGDSGFCTPYYKKILEFKTMYNQYTGEPYKVVRTSDGLYRFDNGKQVDVESKYKIFNYYRQRYE